jgi:hypothetical protein
MGCNPKLKVSASFRSPVAAPIHGLELERVRQLAQFGERVHTMTLVPLRATCSRLPFAPIRSWMFDIFIGPSTPCPVAVRSFTFPDKLLTGRRLREMMNRLVFCAEGHDPEPRN